MDLECQSELEFLRRYVHRISILILMDLECQLYILIGPNFRYLYFNPYFNGFRMSVSNVSMGGSLKMISILILMDLECQYRLVSVSILLM